MLRDLDKIIEEADSSGEDGERLEKELRHAAQHLWRSQFLYQNDWGSKGSYELIRQKMRLEESLLLLVLRLHYEEAFKKYEMNEAGEIEAEGEKILQIYEERTHRGRPPVSVVHEILTGFRQRGLLRIADQGDNRNFTLFLRPALPIVVGEDTLASLEEYVARATNGANAEAVEAPE
jgi:hypothetical protein